MFPEQTRVERYMVVKSLVDCKLSEGGSVSAHVLKMMSYLQRLEKVEPPIIDNDLATDLIFNSLPASYSGFILNYHMFEMEKSLDELHAMLKLHEMLNTVELDMKMGGAHSSHVLAIQAGGKKICKGNKRGKNKRNFKKDKGKVEGKAKAPVVAACTFKKKDLSNVECFYCKSKGHFKRNCHKYLANLRTVATSSGTKE